MSDLTSVIHEKVKCPLCEKTEIDVTTKPEYYSYSAARAFGKVKRIPVHHPEQVKVESNCPNCKAKKSDIKDALERGKSKFKTHEEFLKSIRDRGLPTVITSKSDKHE